MLVFGFTYLTHDTLGTFHRSTNSMSFVTRLYARIIKYLFLAFNKLAAHYAGPNMSASTL